jgi:NAD(P)H-flavin reductase
VSLPSSRAKAASLFAGEETFRHRLGSEAQGGELAAAQLSYYPTVTREPALHNGRISTLLENGRLHADLGLPGFDPNADRFMLCGSPAMIADLRGVLQARGCCSQSCVNRANFRAGAAAVAGVADPGVRVIALFRQRIGGQDTD